LERSVGYRTDNRNGRARGGRMIGWYLSKAEECLRQAKEATNSRIRLRLETEGRQWRAAEIEKSDLKAIAPPQEQSKKE
jgi:hypothetical protein